MRGKILSLLLSVFLAFGIWAYVVTVVSPESEATFYNIPVVLSNENVMTDKGFMIDSDSNVTVTLQLRGNRTDLNKLKNSDIAIVADLSKINGAGMQELSYSVGVSNDFEIIGQYPDKVTLEITEWDTKEVPVNIVYSGTLGMDYIAYKDDVVLETKNVSITGPKSVVDEITQAVIDVNLNNRTETITESYRYTLCDAEGRPVDAASITTNVGEISLNLKIQRVQEVQLLLEITYGGGANADNTLITMSDQVIKVTGTEKMLDNLGTTLVLGAVNLADIAEDTQLSFPITLPEGIENLSGVTEVTVDISFPELATKVLNITKIFVTGMASGMNYEIGTKMVSVTVRGPAELVDTIEAEDVYLLVDLTDAQLGEDLYKAQAWFNTEYEAFGAVGSYSVLVTLTEVPQGEQ